MTSANSTLAALALKAQDLWHYLAEISHTERTSSQFEGMSDNWNWTLSIAKQCGVLAEALELNLGKPTLRTRDGLRIWAREAFVAVQQWCKVNGVDGYTGEVLEVEAPEPTEACVIICPLCSRRHQEPTGYACVPCRERLAADRAAAQREEEDEEERDGDEWGDFPSIDDVCGECTTCGNEYTHATASRLASTCVSCAVDLAEEDADRQDDCKRAARDLEQEIAEEATAADLEDVPLWYQEAHAVIGPCTNCKNVTRTGEGASQCSRCERVFCTLCYPAHAYEGAGCTDRSPEPQGAAPASNPAKGSPSTPRGDGEANSAHEEAVLRLRFLNQGLTQEEQLDSLESRTTQHESAQRRLLASSLSKEERSLLLLLSSLGPCEVDGGALPRTAQSLVNAGLLHCTRQSNYVLCRATARGVLVARVAESLSL